MSMSVNVEQLEFHNAVQVVDGCCQAGSSHLMMCYFEPKMLLYERSLNPSHLLT
jgi:hypothetical protein